MRRLAGFIAALDLKKLAADRAITRMAPPHWCCAATSADGNGSRKEPDAYMTLALSTGRRGLDRACILREDRCRAKSLPTLRGSPAGADFRELQQRPRLTIAA